MALIKHFMTADPVAIQKDKSVFEAVKLMNEKDIDCLIVTDDHKPVAIFTTTDLRVRVVGEGKDPKKTGVLTAATKDIKVLKESDEAMLARNIMSKYQVKHLPIVDDGDLLVGMLSITDLIGEH
ncbi:MAG: CBS domain-containing protein [Candidatus Altiarchaeota archaeon]